YWPPEHAQTLRRQHFHHFAGVLESDHQFGLQFFAPIQFASMLAGATEESVEPVCHYALFSFSFLAHLRLSTLYLRGASTAGVQFGFLRELCGFSSSTPRLKSLNLLIKARDLTAKGAENTRKVRGEIPDLSNFASMEGLPFRLTSGIIRVCLDLTGL